MPLTIPSCVVDWARYVDGHRQADTDLAYATDEASQGNGFIWMGLKDPTDDQMTTISQYFHLHPLAVEDAVEGHGRSKLEQFGDTLFVVISTVAYVAHEDLTDTSEIVSTGQMMIFLNKQFILTVRKGEHSELSNLRHDLEGEPERLRVGPSAVLYSILDKIIDDYQAVTLSFESDIDEVEASVFSRSGTDNVDRVYNLKRELIEFKRAVSPLGIPLLWLHTKEFAAIPDSTRAYFRELADHHTEVKESISSSDEVLSTILQAALARASVTDNEDMRKITAAVAIFAVPTLIAGIYGMNFDNMPELRTRYGYFVVLGGIIVIMLSMLIGFKRNKWL